MCPHLRSRLVYNCEITIWAENRTLSHTDCIILYYTVCIIYKLKKVLLQLDTKELDQKSNVVFERVDGLRNDSKLYFKYNVKISDQKLPKIFIEF